MKLLSHLSIEGYTAQALDLSHWQDPSLLEQEWETKKRPAVVLDVELQDKYWRVKVLPLRRDIDGNTKDDFVTIRVSPRSFGTGANQRWSWEKIIAFAFPNAETFACLADQVNPFCISVSTR